MLSLVEQLWANAVRPENLDTMIIKSVNRAPIDEIIELEDENQYTESMSFSATNPVG